MEKYTIMNIIETITKELKGNHFIEIQYKPMEDCYTNYIIVETPHKKRMLKTKSENFNHIASINDNDLNIFLKNILKNAITYSLYYNEEYHILTLY